MEFDKKWYYFVDRQMKVPSLSLKYVTVENIDLYYSIFKNQTRMSFSRLTFQMVHCNFS